jgi:hypothetical protein
MRMLGTWHQRFHVLNAANHGAAIGDPVRRKKVDPISTVPQNLQMCNSSYAELLHLLKRCHKAISFNAGNFPYDVEPLLAELEARLEKEFGSGND